MRIHIRHILILSSLILLIPRLAPSQSKYFSTDPIWNSGPFNFTQAISLGDFDLDGDLDLLCGNVGVNTLYLNENGVFARIPVGLSSTASFKSISIGDVDGDGDLDLACGIEQYSNMLFFNEEGIFSKEPKWSFGYANWTLSVLLGDVDGDKDLDIVFGNSGDNTLYLNDGNGSAWTFAWNSGVYNVTSSVSLGDIDSDGDLDLVCGNSGANTLYFNEGGKFSVLPSWSSNSTNSTQDISLGDIDGDGDLDLVCGNNGANTLYLNIDGVFDSIPVWSSGPTNFTFSVSLGDIDLDNDLDLVCGNFDTNNTLYVNEGGIFDSIPAWLSGPANNTMCIALGDVDGDGDLDLVCGNGGQSNTLYLNERQLFTSAQSLPPDLTNSTYSITLGDIDGDKNLDLICGNRNKSNTLHLNKDGVFDSIPTWSSNPTYKTHSVLLEDIDGDEDLDLVCGNWQDSNTLYLNDGGNLVTIPTWSSGRAYTTASVSLGDVDGDGDPDLVCGNWEDSNTLYINDGGIFTSEPVWSSTWSNKTVSISLGDVDGDRDLDLVCQSEINGSIRLALYPNEGGVFDLSPIWWSDHSEYSWSVSLGDVDGDGDLDLISGNYDGVNTLYLNNGGMFATLPIWSSGQSNFTVSVSLGDLDGDGDLDLACGNGGYENNQINTLYLNEGGIFTLFPVWTTNMANQTLCMTMGDIDRDGDLDVVYGNNYGQANTLYRSVRAPVYRGNTLYPTNQLPNNSGFIQSVSIDNRSIIRYCVSFSAIDVESDPIWILPKYQFKGDPTWYGVKVEDQHAQRIGPFSTSPEGIINSFNWDVSVIPFDYRDIILRLIVIEIPQRVSINQQVSSYLQDVGKILSIASNAKPRNGIEFFQGRDIIVDLMLPPGTKSDHARLYFRRGGEKDFQVIGFENSDPIPFATISSEWVGERGIEYWLELTTAMGVLSDPPRYPSQYPHTIQVTTINLKENRSHPAERYRLMSIPLELEGSLSIISALEDDIGFPDPMRWRMYAYDIPGSAYVEVPNDTLSSFEHGRGYWLITKEDHRLDTGPVFGRSTPTDRAFKLVLEPGWNLIGQPFGFPVAWDSAHVNGLTMTNVTFVEPPVAWTGERYKYDMALLESWRGYWVKNLADTAVVLEIPPREYVSPMQVVYSPLVAGSAKNKLSSGEWTLAITATSRGTADTHNQVGIKRDASTSWDTYDRSEVPMSPGKSISLYFPHSTWGKHPGNYTVDIRGEYEELGSEALGSSFNTGLRGHLWHFDVAKSFSSETAGDEVRFEFIDVESLPADADIYFIDTYLERLIDVREKTGYSFYLGKKEAVPDETEARFILVVGSEDFIDTQKLLFPKPPTETVLHQNYPNPFNPSTIIRYDLATPGNVSLKVYNAGGALVRILYDGPRLESRYEVGWNGENENGERVSSGVYFYRLTAPGFAQTRKMVLLK